jgi:hypothetical protein
MWADIKPLVPHLSACVRNSTNSACARSDSASVHSLMPCRRLHGYVCACCTLSWQFIRLSARRVLVSCSMRRQSALSCATDCEKQLVPSTRSKKPSMVASCSKVVRKPAGVCDGLSKNGVTMPENCEAGRCSACPPPGPFATRGTGDGASHLCLPLSGLRALQQTWGRQQQAPSRPKPLFLRLAARQAPPTIGARRFV